MRACLCVDLCLPVPVCVVFLRAVRACECGFVRVGTFLYGAYGKLCPMCGRARCGGCAKGCVCYSICRWHPPIQVCLQLVQQFSSDKSSAVGMTLEFHRSCMLSWQQFGLKEVFTLCLQKLFMLQPVVAGACPCLARVLPVRCLWPRAPSLVVHQRYCLWLAPQLSLPLGPYAISHTQPQCVFPLAAQPTFTGSCA